MQNLKSKIIESEIKNCSTNLDFKCIFKLFNFNFLKLNNVRINKISVRFEKHQ